MPSEYEELVAALKLSDVPVAEYGWKSRPEGAYRIVRLDFESESIDGDDVKLDREWEGSLDLFFPKLSSRKDLVEETEEILTEIFGSRWRLHSTQYESGTGLFHFEWIFEAMDTAEEGERDAEIQGEC